MSSYNFTISPVIYIRDSRENYMLNEKHFHMEPNKFCEFNNLISCFAGTKLFEQ